MFRIRSFVPLALMPFLAIAFAFTPSLGGQVAPLGGSGPAHELTVNTLGNGTVVIDPDQPSYSDGQVVTLTATPSDNWRFVGFSGGLASVSGSSSVTITSDLVIDATFSDLALDENFESFATGANPSGWIDTDPFPSLLENDALFSVRSFGGSQALTTTSTLTNIHSHYLPANVGEMNGYEYTGRMRISNSQAGIGVTFFSGYPDDTSYYRLRRYLSNSFHITASGTAITGGSIESGVVPTANTWYRFRVQIEDTATQTEIRANVWLASDPEPAGWQIDAFDSSATRLTNGTVGAWSFYLGTKGWDDLQVRALPTTALFDVSVTPTGLGTVTRSPDLATYAYGDVVTLTATGDPGSAFAGWSGDLSGASNPVDVTVTRDLAIDAAFVPMTTHTLTVSATGDGEVFLNPDLPTYTLGSTVELSAVPDAGWSFAGFDGDVTSSANPLTVTITGDLSIDALFEPFLVLETFDGAVGSDPLDWFDTETNNSLVENDSYFSIADLSGESVFHTPLPLTNIHSHYVGAGGAALADYRFTGRMRLSTTAGGVGVTFLSQYPNVASYYRLRRYSGTQFHITARGSTVSGEIDSGVTPLANVWYRFALEVEDTGARTEIRAKVWADGGAEPSAWQIDCFDDSATRLTQGTIGAWCHGSGSKYWDNFEVSPLGTAPAPVALTVSSSGLGSVVAVPDLPVYPVGSAVELTAIPDTGSVFTGWSGSVTSLDNPLTLTLFQDEAVTANFAPVVQHTLNVTTVGSGVVTKSPDQAAYLTGTVVTLSATADPDWSFVGYSGDVTSVLPTIDVVVSGDLDVVAIFGQSLVTQTFDLVPVGSDPPGWFDTDINRSLLENDSIFKVLAVGSDSSFGTVGNLPNVHSHYVVPPSEQWSNYELTGRMRMSDADSGLGVTLFSQYPNDGRYYRLRRYAGTGFVLHPFGTPITAGDIETGVVPVSNQWYRFKAQIEDGAGVTKIRARVWGDGATEPTQWQIQCEDSSATRLTQGTFGVWTHGVGAKYFDDFEVQPLDAPATFDLDVVSHGGGDVAVSPEAELYVADSVVTATASPQAGWTFREWAGTVNSTTNPLTLTMDQDHVVAAVFTPSAVDEGFDLYVPTDNPADWVDTEQFNSLVENDTYFEVFDVDGDNALGTTLPVANAHSHYTGAGSATLENYAFTGRMRLSSLNGGVGVTFLSGYPAEASYYRLRRFAGTSFHISPLGTLLSGGNSDTGVTPQADVWYRFAIAVVDTGTRTEIRAKVWADGSPEPATWQADCFDDNPTRLTQGTIGTWVFGAGSKFVDGLTVELPTTSGPFTLGLTTTGDGVATATPDLPQYNFGDVVDLQATANAGSVFVGWQGDVTGFDNPRSTVVTSDQTVVANFSAVATHTVDAVAGVGGSVAIDPDTASYSTGDFVRIDATADIGYMFTGFSGTLVSDQNPLEFLVDSDHSLTANFAAVPYTISSTVVGNGTVVRDPDLLTYTYGDVVTITAVPDFGASFDGFSGDINGTANPVTVMVTGDIDITAEFVTAIVDQSFVGYPAGGQPIDWVDTQPAGSLFEDDSLFSVELFAGDPALHTTSTANNIHSHFVADGASQLTNYRFTGRMMAGDATSGVGVTFFSQFDAEAKYYRLRRFDGTSFHIQPLGTQISGGVTDTGVTPVTGMWYRFEVEVEDTGTTTAIRAKVWTDGTAAPASWQVDCFDDTADRMTAGTIGCWSNGVGSKSFDDLRVVSLVQAVPVTLTINVVGDGTVTVDPDLPSYAIGDIVTLTAIPTPGALFDFWSDGLGTSASVDVLMTSDRTVSAHFAAVELLFQDNFEFTPVLADPAGWLDTGPLNSLTPANHFAVYDLVAGGNQLFGTNSTATNIHSHYVVPGSELFKNYEVTGLLYMTHPESGIGITFFSDFPNTARYYRMRRFGTGSFFIDPLGTLMTGGTTDSGVVPLPNVDYRYRIRVEDTGTQTEVRARVWEDGTAEPADWQIDCFDDSATRLTRGTVGVWTFNPGSKFFDDFWVQPLDLGEAPARAFFDHFSGAAIEPRWASVVSGSGSVTLTGDSSVEIMTPSSGDAAFLATNEPIDLTQTQTWLFCARNLGGGNLEDLIGLWNLQPGVMPTADTLAANDSQRLGAISMVDDGSNPTVRFRFDPTSDGTGRYWAGEPTNQWTSPDVLADAVANVRTGADADWYTLGLDIDAQRERLRFFSLHQVETSLAGTAQGVRMVALTDWVLFTSLAGGSPMDNVWLTMGDRHTDAASAHFEFEWVRLEDGQTLHAFTNARTDAASPYSLRHVTSRNTLFLPDGRGDALFPTPSPWDAGGYRKKHVLRDNDGTHYLYYEGFDSGGESSIGLATSPSPEGPWTPYPLNPIITPSILPAGSASYDVITAPLVVKDDRELDPNKRWRLFFVGEIEGTSTHRLFLASSPSAVGPWQQEVGPGPDGAIMWERLDGGWRNDGMADPVVFFNHDTSQWNMFHSGLRAGDGWTVGFSTSDDLIHWAPSTLVVTGSSTGVRSWTSVNGKFITISDASAMREDAIVFIRNQSTVENWGISRIRKINGNTLELYHQIGGIGGTASNRTVAQLGSGSITPHAIRRHDDGTYRLFVTAFQPFILAFGSFGNCEVAASLTAPTLAGPWTWDDLTAPNVPLDIWGGERANENIGWIGEPVTTP